MKNILTKIWPFIAFGIMVFIFVAGFVILAYVLIFGALIGLVLFVIQWVRQKLSATPPPAPTQKVEHEGRTIDHDDI